MTVNTNGPVDPDPMPHFDMLGKDRHAPQTILFYAARCADAGNHDQAAEAMQAYREMVGWQERNLHQVKEPDHKHVPAQS